MQLNGNACLHALKFVGGVRTLINLIMMPNRHPLTYSVYFSRTTFIAELCVWVLERRCQNSSLFIDAVKLVLHAQLVRPEREQAFNVF